MANLALWQKLTRVLPGRPFGDGVDGNYSSASIPTLKYKSCSGTATSTTLSADTDTSPYIVGDVLLLYQTRGTGVGQWEINRVLAVGSDSYTMQVALNYTYTDSGASQAQAIKIPRYTDVTVSAGTWTITDFDGDIGGVLTFASNGLLTVTGTIAGSGKGFRGGVGGNTTPLGNRTGFEGEGTSGTSDTQTTSANGNGGGGGGPTDDGGSHSGAGGGGGGYASAGSNGTTGAFAGTVGTGGSAVNAADLTTFNFGGAGGGGGGEASYTGGTGGDGAGGIFIFAKNIVSVNAINCNGLNGTSGTDVNSSGGGGGGAGGSCLIACQVATLGTNVITATAGTGGASGGAGGNGGNGSVGRIAIHHSGTVTGTTNPTFTDVSDGSLTEQNAWFLFM